MNRILWVCTNITVYSWFIADITIMNEWMVHVKPLTSTLELLLLFVFVGWNSDTSSDISPEYSTNSLWIIVKWRLLSFKIALVLANFSLRLWVHVRCDITPIAFDGATVWKSVSFCVCGKMPFKLNRRMSSQIVEIYFWHTFQPARSTDVSMKNSTTSTFLHVKTFENNVDGISFSPLCFLSLKLISVRAFGLWSSRVYETFTNDGRRI